jgi:hypothetical protein
MIKFTKPNRIAISFSLVMENYLASLLMYEFAASIIEYSAVHN